MIDRLEILASRLRRLVSRNRWSARILGVPPAVGHGDEVGLILVQIDGLGEATLRRALDEGRMPFLRHLIEGEGFALRSLYTGMPSSTPGFQAELFFGTPTAVPAFGYYDRELARVISMNDPIAASIVEARLLREGRGLFQGGSAWANIYGGEAAEPHFCASTTGLARLTRALNPIRLIGLVLWNFWSVARVLFHLVAESGVALWDFVKGTRDGRDVQAELRFVPARVIVSAVMREVVCAGACIDAERGLPIIQLNLLGYDEHAHRRGPDSRFALWTLKGIDRAIKRVWMAAHRSTLRDYQVWVYSDHGQENTVPYPVLHGESVEEAVRRVALRVHEELREGPLGSDRIHGTVSSGTERAQWLHRDLPEWMPRPRDPGEETAGNTATLDADADGRPDELVVIDQGPVGFVVLPEPRRDVELALLARRLCDEAQIPMVLRKMPGGRAAVHRPGGEERMLPEDAAEVFGADHPHRGPVTEDTLRVVHHPSGGDLVLMGWNPDLPLSLQLENGAHGGPGPMETSAFALLSPEAASKVDPGTTMRPETLRTLALHCLEGVVGTGRAFEPVRPTPHPDEEAPIDLRLVSYNVHGCRGMDGKFSPHRIARAIARLQPDVICLQELDESRARSGYIDQIAAIAETLETDYLFHPVAEVDDGRFGNAVLSPHPLRTVKSGPLPALPGVPGLEDRGVLWVEVEIGGQAVQILNTHLSILRQERRLQVEALLGEEWLGDPRCRAPLVLCGDFNAAPASYTVRRVEERLRNVDRQREPGSTLHTWSSRIPMRRIDHCFVGGPMRVRRVEVPRTRLTRVASDHLPLVVELSCCEPETG